MRKDKVALLEGGGKYSLPLALDCPPPAPLLSCVSASFLTVNGNTPLQELAEAEGCNSNVMKRNEDENQIC